MKRRTVISAGNQATPVTDTPATPIPRVSTWSCVEHEVTCSVTAHDGVSHPDSAPFITAQIFRPSDELLRFELRSSADSRPTPITSDWGKFFVPIEVAPHLPAYFAEILRRLAELGMLAPGEDYIAIAEHTLSGVAK